MSTAVIPQVSRWFSWTYVQPHQLVFLVTSLAVVVTYAHVCYVNWPTLAYTADGWASLELAQSFDSDPFRFNTFRSYLSSDYSAATPFGFPWVLWVLQKVFGPHPAVGGIFNCAVALLTPWVAELLCRRLTDLRGAGFLAGTLLVLYPPYMFEVVGNKSIPLTLILFLLAYYLWYSAAEKRSLPLTFAGGVLIGACALVRFDAVLLCAALAALLGLRARSLGFPVVFVAGAVLAMAPWIAYSLHHFSTPWISDNSWVATSANAADVTDYPTKAAQTVFSAPGRWAARIARNLVELAWQLGLAFLKHGAAIVVLLGAVLATRRPGAANSSRAMRPAVWLCLAALMGLGAYVLSGYFDHRYFSLLFFSVALAVSVAHFSSEDGARSRTAIACCIGVAFAVANLWAIKWWSHDYSARLQREAAQVELMQRVAACHAREQRVMYLYPYEVSYLGARYGFTYGFRTGIVPHNWSSLDEELKRRFVAELGHVRFVSFDWSAEELANAARCWRGIAPQR